MTRGATATRALLLVVLAIGCGTPIGVHRADPRDVRAALTQSVLSDGRPSLTTRYLLHKTGLEDRWTKEPEAVLRELHEALPASTLRQEWLAGLAELSFLHAERKSDPRHYLAAAVYAYGFLFPADPILRPRAFDPRLRTTADLYNRSLARGLTRPGAESADLRARTLELPFGSLEMDVEGARLEWGGYRLRDFRHADAYRVRGLGNRYRQAGIGAPLLAGLELLPGATAPESHRIPPDLRVPATIFLRLSDASPPFTRLAGTLEVYVATEAESIEVGGERVDLEFERSAALALALEESGLWDLELSGLLSNDIVPARYEDGLAILRPYHPGQIPVVFVHGTASSPARWAPIANEFAGADARLRTRFTPWLFLYTTGNPVLHSAAQLRRALRETIRELDPDGKDPALRRMVLVGHSQGGLLVRLAVTQSGNAFWNLLSDEPFEDFDLEPDVRELLRDALFFEPLPFVERVVFLATPHGGSRLATNGVSNLAAHLIRMPGSVSRAALLAVSSSSDAGARRQLPTSIEDMNPNSNFVAALATLPIDPHVKKHSIIAVRSDGPLEEADDGVVRYTSAHLDGVISEKIVRSGHSLQGKPGTIAEVSRILGEHLEEGALVPEPLPGGPTN